MTDEDRANMLTKWLIVTIGAPAIIIAVGELVARPIWVLLSLAGFDPARHLVITNTIRVVVVGGWISGSVWLIRLMWPKKWSRSQSDDAKSPSEH